jgi:N-acetylglucosamine-6-phosphate deacetylase
MASPLALLGCEARTPTERISDALLLIEGKRIAYAGPRSGVSVPPGAERFDLAGALVSPGYLDLQVNGLGADALLPGEKEAVARIARTLARRGTTSFLPTATTHAPEVLLRAARAVQAAWESEEADGTPGASILGLHLEGPFLEPAMRGAHPEEHIRPVDLEEVERIAGAAGGWGTAGRPGLAMVTLSPEVEGAAEAVRALSARGVVVAMGHTAAPESAVAAFLEAGARFAVHAFNRYRAPGEDPSLSGPSPASLSSDPMRTVRSDPRLRAGIVADGVHVKPEILADFVRARGGDRIVLTSDLVSDGGLSGEGGKVASGASVWRDGVLAGSRLSVGEMVPLLKKECGLEAGAALAAATANPAKVLGLERRLGSLAPGFPADLCVLDPESLEVRGAMAGGRWASRPA